MDNPFNPRVEIASSVFMDCNSLSQKANRITLNPLDVESIKNSYFHIFKEAGYQLDIPTVIYMTKQTMGFAYAFQLLGYWVWKAASEQVDKVITKETVN